MSESLDHPQLGASEAGAGQHNRRWRVRRLAAARVVSASGSQAAQIALVYQIYAVTHSGTWVAVALFTSIAAGGLMGPLAGWLADRLNRRTVMVASELGAGLAYVTMVFLHRPALLVCGVLAATMLGAPFRAASAAAIPNLVAPGDLSWANGLLGSAFNLALVAGPLLGGALVAASGAALVYAVNAISFLVSAVVIVFVGGDFGGGRRGAPQPAAGNGLLAGFRMLGRDRGLRLLAVASGFAWAAFGSALVIDPALAHHFHAGSVGYGLLTAVWGGGAVLGSFVAGKIIRVDSAPSAVAWGMTAMAVSLGSIVVLPTFALIVAAGAMGGLGNGFVFIPWLLLIQHRTADAIRGRVIAAAEAFDQIAFFAGMGLAVPALNLIGPHHAYALTGTMLVGAAITAVRAMLGPARTPQIAAA